MFVMFYICYKSKKEHVPPEMTIQECVYYTTFSVHSLLQYIVSVTYTKFLYMGMTIALKSLNEMQQTARMRLTIIQHDITVVYVTYFPCITIQCSNIIRLWATKRPPQNKVCRL